MSSSYGMGGYYCDFGYHDYQVVVGKIGTVYDGNDRVAAHDAYRTYCAEVDLPSGEVSGESVAIILWGDVAWHKESTHEEVSED